MPKRGVDKRKTSKALRKLRKAAERATGVDGPGLTTWEKEFVEGVSGRLETYGSAFRDPGKGRLDKALSQRQSHVVRAIDKKSRKAAKSLGAQKAGPGAESGEKPRTYGSTLKRKSPMRNSRRPAGNPRIRDINDDPAPAPETPDTRSPAEKRAALRLIPGGRRS